MGSRRITRTPRWLWWREVLYIAAFYFVYSSIRNLFGSAQVSPATALQNAYRLIDLERALFLYHEPELQQAFLGWQWFVKLWNVYYGTFHFVVTGGVLVWLFLKADELRYRRWRNTLALMTALALLGFALFPLMPPRLLPDCGQFGGCVTAPFVDTLARYGGLWSFRSGPMEAISNQYAAMPSLHIGWALWCIAPFIGRHRSRWWNGLLALYPLVTLFAIVVTGNHFILDAAGGLIVFEVGRRLAFRFTRPVAASSRGPLSRRDGDDDAPGPADRTGSDEAVEGVEPAGTLGRSGTDHDHGPPRAVGYR